MHIFLAHFFDHCVRVNWKEQFFSESGHVANQTKEKEASTTYANKNYVLTLTLEPYVGFKAFFFS